MVVWIVNLLSVANANNMLVLHKRNTLHMNLDIAQSCSHHCCLPRRSVCVCGCDDSCGCCECCRFEVAAAALLAVVAGVGGGIN